MGVIKFQGYTVGHNSLAPSYSPWIKCIAQFMIVQRMYTRKFWGGKLSSSIFWIFKMSGRLCEHISDCFVYTGESRKFGVELLMKGGGGGELKKLNGSHLLSS